MPAKKKTEKAKPDLFLPSPGEIVAHLDQYIIGQAEAKQILASACYCHAHNCATLASLDDPVWPDDNVLMAGPTGSGKSEMIRVICDFLRLPYYQVDCTSLSPTGYKGLNVENVIDNLESHFVSDGLSPVACIVVWDELDKLLDDGTDAAEYRRMLQTDLLRILEAAKKCDELNTSRILHLACGAFVGLDDIRHPKQSPTIGFGEHGSLSDVTQKTVDKEVKAEHFVEYGLIPELVGRFGRFTSLRPLSLDDMVSIMTDSKISFLGRKAAQYERHGTQLVFTEGAVIELARLAMNHPSGARGLRQLVNKALAPWDFLLADLKGHGIHEIHYDACAVHDGSKARLITGERSRAMRTPAITQIPEKAPKTYDDVEEDDDDDICIF